MPHTFQRIALGLLASCAVNAQVDVLTAQYGNGRTSANMQEQVLNPSNVNATQFGLLFSRPVDGPVYALPLVVTQFKLPSGSVRDIVIVATLNNSVYAYDADDAAQTSPYWHVNLGPALDTGDLFLGPVIGILSTPAIDRLTNTIYLTAMIDNSGDVGIYLFALDLGNGTPKYNSPQRAVLPLATGEQETNATAWYQRAGLLVSNHAVYVGYTYVSDDALSIQHGFVQAFQADDLSVRLASWESSPTTPHGGVWQAGRGLAADTLGNLFVSTADGEWNGTTDFGNSVVELTPRSLNVESYFTPSNWLALFQGDTDLGANGVTLMPNTNLAVTGGKQGIVYLMNGINLGGLEKTGLVPIQSFQASNGCGYTQCGQNLSTAYWANGINPYLFVWDKQDFLRAYPFDPVTQRFLTDKVTVGTVLPNSTGGVVVTSDGITPRSGVVWANTTAQSPFQAAVPGTLRAYDALDITNEIYNSDQNAGRDATGSFVKFVSPVVANGHVYLGNQSGSLQVYGLLCQANQAGNLTVNLSHEKPQPTGGPKPSPGPRVMDYTQEITITNDTLHSIAGPFSIAFADLPQAITLVGGSGSTSCAAPHGSPLVAATAAPHWLQPGQSFNVDVTFEHAANEKLAYTPVVLAGSGGQ